MRICKLHSDTTWHNTKDGKLKCRKCMYLAVKRRRHKLKHMSVEYKGGKCSKCGYDKCLAALEFHHLDPNQKDFSIGTNRHNRSWEITRIELDKCILLCSNCHREEHDKLSAEVRSLS